MNDRLPIRLKALHLTFKAQPQSQALMHAPRLLSPGYPRAEPGEAAFSWPLHQGLKAPNQEPYPGSSCHSSAVMNATGIHEDAGSSPGLTQWFKDLVLLWLWYRLTAAAPVQPLAWELLYATRAALKIYLYIYIYINYIYIVLNYVPDIYI